MNIRVNDAERNSDKFVVTEVVAWMFQRTRARSLLLEAFALTRSAAVGAGGDLASWRFSDLAIDERPEGGSVRKFTKSSDLVQIFF